jgi:hypothetical protein
VIPRSGSAHCHQLAAMSPNELMQLQADMLPSLLHSAASEKGWMPDCRRHA